MKSVVILRDHHGYPSRRKAMMDAHPSVRSVSPTDCYKPGTLMFSVPDDWLPADESKPRSIRQWFKAEAMCVAAVKNLRIKSDYYWFIESDVCATQEAWKSLFDDHKNNTADCISNPIRDRSNSRPEYWTHAGTPEWASSVFVTACFRLSARAVDEIERCAVEMRETFCGIAAASVLKRAGMTFSAVNSNKVHWNDQTFKGVDRCIVNEKLVNHPLKFDSYGPS